MKFIVKIRVHDWPKRSNTLVDKIEVEAVSREEAFAKAPSVAQEKYPTGKIRAFDVTGAPVDERPVLTVKKKVA